MSGKLMVTGMVLSEMPIGDYDKRILILTKELGKVSAFARGARRPGNALTGKCRPFTFSSFELYKGKNSYTVVSIDVVNYFTDLSEDLEGTYYAFYFLELADYFGREGIDGEETLKLLYQTFRALLNKNIENALIRTIYELRLFMINGEYPQISSCYICGTSENLIYYSSRKKSSLCKECDFADKRKMNTSTFYTMQFIISTPIEKLYSFKVSSQVQKELDYIMKNFINDHIDKKIKSLEILENIIIKG